jgi:hypothetical protein
MEQIQRIKAPKFKMGRYSLNEYELRCLQVRVAKNEVHSGIIIKDKNGKKATIKEDGTLSNNLSGLEINSKFTLEILRIKREKK